VRASLAVDVALGWSRRVATSITGTYAVPVQGVSTFDTTNRWASFGDGVPIFIAGIALVQMPIGITIRRISVRLPGILTGVGTADFGIYDFTANAFRTECFASIAAGESSATGVGELTLIAGRAYCIECRRTGGSVAAISPTGLVIEYTAAPEDGFFFSQRNGSVASGVPITQFFPHMFRGSLSATDGYLAATAAQKVSVVPKATLIKRMAMSNSSVPATTTNYQMSVGGVLTGPIISLPGASNPAFVNGDIEVTIPAATSAAEAATNWATWRVTSVGAITLQPLFAFSYLASLASRQWMQLGWARRLISGTPTYDGFNSQTGSATQSLMQARWTTPGRFRELLLVVLPENTSGDKTYEVHLEVNGVSVFSTSFTNNAATVVVSVPMSVTVALDDLVNWRTQMNGGFTASRSINVLGVAGFESS
jgi:hypothetical protein